MDIVYIDKFYDRILVEQIIETLDTFPIEKITEGTSSDEFSFAKSKYLTLKKNWEKLGYWDKENLPIEIKVKYQELKDTIEYMEKNMIDARDKYISLYFKFEKINSSINDLKKYDSDKVFEIYFLLKDYKDEIDDFEYKDLRWLSIYYGRSRANTCLVELRQLRKNTLERIKYVELFALKSAIKEIQKTRYLKF